MSDAQTVSPCFCGCFYILTHPLLVIGVRSEAFHFGGGGGRAFVFGFAWLEVVDYVEGETPPVQAHAFVHEDAVSPHRPVVVGSVEDVGGGEFDGQRFIEECFANRCVHFKP